MTRTKDERGQPMSFAVRTGGRNSGGIKIKPQLVLFAIEKDMRLKIVSS